MVNSSRRRPAKLAFLIGIVSAFAPLRASALEVDEVFQKWNSKQPTVRKADDDEDHSTCGFEFMSLGKDAYFAKHRAANLNASGHFDEAVSEYTKLLQRRPNESDYLNGRAYAYEHVGKFESALADLRPPNIRADCRVLVRVLFELGYYQDAIDEIDREILTNASRDTDLLYLKARAEQELGRSEKAASDYRIAATEYMLAGTPDGARNCVDRTAALKNLSSSAKFSLGDLKFNSGHRSRVRVSRLLEHISKSDNPINFQKLDELISAPTKPGENDCRLTNVGSAEASLFKTYIPFDKIYFPASKAISLLGPPSSVSEDEQPFQNAQVLELDWTLAKGKLTLSFFKSGAKSLTCIEFRGTDYDRPAPLPSSVNDLAKAGTQALSQKQYDDAITFLNQLIQKQPDFALAYEQLSIAYMGKNDFAKALESINKYLELSPGEIFLECFSRAKIYEKLGLLDKAIDDLSVDIDSPTAKQFPELSKYSYPLRGDLYWKKKEYKKALADYEELNKLAPSGEIIEHKALIEYELGDKNLAREDMKKAVELLYYEARIVRRDQAVKELSLMEKGEPSAAVHPANET